MVIPAHPLALTAARKLDERRQRALTRYYLDAGASGVAVGVHTTQFAIRSPKFGLYRPVLQLAAETVAEWERSHGRAVLRVAGVTGGRRQAAGDRRQATGDRRQASAARRQATEEARVARDLGYDVALLSLGGLSRASDAQLIAHCRAVAETIPLMGFYLQPSVGGRALSYRFWRRFAEIDEVVAIKIAPFNRYATLDVIRAVADAGREKDIMLLTGNGDSIVADLLTTWRFRRGRREVTLRMSGGLLGHWAYWTRASVRMVDRVARVRGRSVPASLLSLGAATTDANGAIFDAANGFRGCIPGIHEILRRQGLLRGRWCLDPKEELSPGQMEEIDRVCNAYPNLADDAFVEANLGKWMA